MTRYSVAFGTSWTKPPSTAGSFPRPLGSLHDGYYLTLGNSQNDLKSYAITAPTTTVDTYSFPFAHYVKYVAANSTSSIWLLREGPTASEMYVTEVTQSGGIISATDTGTVAVNYYGGQALMSSDDSELILSTGFGHTVGIATTAGTVNFDIDWTGSGHAPYAYVSPQPDQFISYCYTHSAYELWEGSTATLLDSMTFPSGFGSYAWDTYAACCVGSGKAFFSWGADASDNRRMGVLDTSGGTLSWAVGPKDYPFDWGRDVDAWGASYGSTVVIGPEYFFPPTPALRLYVFDAVKGHLSQSTTSTLIGQGVQSGSTNVDMFWLDADTVVLSPDGYSTWSSWDLTALPEATATYLRQRQSPVRTPSRVRGVDLRQRQSARIT